MAGTTILAATILGIDWIKILLHFVVFAVLFVGLTLLLYKPILKFIRERRQSIQDDLDKGQAMQQQAESIRQEYQGKLQQAQQEADQIIAEAQRSGDAIVQQATDQAQRQSQQILQQARQDALVQQQEAVRQADQDLTALAVDIAQELLQRQITVADDERLIQSCLDQWSNDHD